MGKIILLLVIVSAFGFVCYVVWKFLDKVVTKPEQRLASKVDRDFNEIILQLKEDIDYYETRAKEGSLYAAQKVDYYKKQLEDIEKVKSKLN